MAEVATKPKHPAKAPAMSPEFHLVPLTSVVDRTTELSDQVLTSLEKSERAALEAVGRFVISVEEALPQEVAGTTDIAKKITEAGLEMTDRLVHTTHEFLHDVIDGTAAALKPRGGTKPIPTH